MGQLRNIIFFLLYIILFRPKLFFLLFKDVFLPVYVQYEWLKKYPIHTIIDIGANRGNVTVALAILFPKADIYAFEPIKKESDVIKKKTAHLSHVTVINMALSNKIGKIPFFINQHSPSSSMLPFSSFGKKRMPLITIAKKIFIDSLTLDSYFKDKNIKPPIFIKIDVQGAEKLVLDGGTELPKKASIIHIETGFENVYENQCLFDDIYRLLTTLDFKYYGSMVDGHFYPLLTLEPFENSIFIKNSL